MSKIVGNTVGFAGSSAKTYILETEDQSVRLEGVLVGQETIFDVTPNDVRIGKTYAGGSGVKVGEKLIPIYYSSNGNRKISAGDQLSITGLKSLDRYDFTKLQIIVCEFNNTIEESLKAIMIVIDDGLYSVDSLERISVVQKDHETKTINLGVRNESDIPYVIRYFTYKEII